MLQNETASVALHVQRQVVRPRERPRAEVTLERLEARVLSVVPGQFVRPSILPLAALPRALVRLLTRVGPLVGL